MDNGPDEAKRKLIREREAAAIARNNRKREAKEAASSIVKRPARKKPSVRRKTAKNPVVQTYKPFDYPAYRPGMKTEFYQTREWRSVRYDVIRSSNGKCVLCGRSPAAHGVVLHVDHIKPRSKFPALELDCSNLQVLCEDCNIGKGAKT